MSELGRGSSSIHFTDTEVIKVAPMLEAQTMMKYPGVFVAVKRLAVLREGPEGMCEYVMPLASASRPEDLRAALLTGLEKLKLLWQVQRPTWLWREELTEHIIKQAHDFDLNSDMVMRLLESLPDPTRFATIHGDPTLANIVYRGKSWWWIDPLDRPYIPGDPHVDLGKMFQSCLGYERVILGYDDELEADTKLMRKLAAKSCLSYSLAFAWCQVHMIRLLRYQFTKDAEICVRWLHNVGF